ncbi:hypothetical protein FRACYDRAFT_237423 [Fragilariopsis cylindrus CCMP1102]|uniref:Uncharacterized protein n=1 Tax=Fragilariopsis cylindrus CCMP1102 TaxID=635003 RepID=A0A1E7FMW5_9STRA|nr:hypothetical protein FRACYDRAFT_237423 [Fragilariopsis cylindrus CCMP1102]|eukprot:OEU19133.1 hypothetical protein FRACYDRAFT_237423 [Fragilariopsis cylindrus CCMP1102]
MKLSNSSISLIIASSATMMITSRSGASLFVNAYESSYISSNYCTDNVVVAGCVPTYFTNTDCNDLCYQDGNLGQNTDDQAPGNPPCLWKQGCYFGEGWYCSEYDAINGLNADEMFIESRITDGCIGPKHGASGIGMKEDGIIYCNDNPSTNSLVTGVDQCQWQGYTKEVCTEVGCCRWSLDPELGVNGCMSAIGDFLCAADDPKNP